VVAPTPEAGLRDFALSFTGAWSLGEHVWSDEA
jgi:hypothetical protein